MLPPPPPPFHPPPDPPQVKHAFRLLVIPTLGNPNSLGHAMNVHCPEDAVRLLKEPSFVDVDLLEMEGNGFDAHKFVLYSVCFGSRLRPKSFTRGEKQWNRHYWREKNFKTTLEVKE